MSPFDRAHTTSYLTLIETMCLSCTVFEIIAGYLSKVADFDHPTCIWRPHRGVTPVEFRGDLWHQKNRLPGVSCGVVCVILCLAVLVELRLVADRRTDGQTDGQADTGPWLVPRMHSIALINYSGRATELGVLST